MQHQEEYAGVALADLPISLHHDIYHPKDQIDCAFYRDLTAYVTVLLALSSLAGWLHPVAFHGYDGAPQDWADQAAAWLSTAKAGPAQYPAQGPGARWQDFRS